MNIFDLADTLPNGLHDAQLTRLSVDYRERIVILEMSIWIQRDGTPAELYRPARITLRDVTLLSIEPPDPSYPYQTPGPLTIDLSVPASELPAGAGGSPFRLFIGQYNSFLNGSAGEAALEWLGTEAVS